VIQSAKNVLREDHPVGADRRIVEAIGVRIDRLVNARRARDRDIAMMPPSTIACDLETSPESMG
jgi:hypothetical protein